MKKIALLLIGFIVSLSTPAYAGKETSETLSLKTVLQHVYLNNPTIQASRQELKSLAENYPQALAGWRPNINAEASIYTTDIESSNFAGGTGATTKDFYVDIEQPLFRGGRTLAETDQALNLIRAGQMSARSLEQEIFLRAITAYLNVRQTRALYELRRDNENIIDKELEASRERFTGGELTITDVHQAEARFAAAQAARLETETDYGSARSEFERITGIYPDTPLQPVNFPSEIPATMDAALKQAENHNPRLLAAIYRHKASKDNADSQLRALYPNLFAFASYNKQFDPQPGIVDDTEVQTVGLRLTIPLYEGGAARSRIREARHLAGQRRAEITETRREIRSAFIRNWHNFFSARTETAIRDTQIKAAKAARIGVVEESHLGERSILDILDADQEMIEAKTAKIRAEHDQHLARAELIASMGALTPALFGIKASALDFETHLSELKHNYFGISAE